MNLTDNKPHIDVTGAVIWKDGQVLITKRPEGTHLGGMWEFPGGKQKESETLELCLEREIKEELGMDIRAEKHLLTVHHEYETKHVTLYFYNCSIVSGEPDPKEGQDIKWTSTEDLGNYTFPPPDLEIIELLISNRFRQ